MPGRNRAWESLAYQAWGMGYIDARHTEQVPNREEQPTVLTFYAPLCSNRDLERHELLREGWEFWARLVLQALEQMHPDISELITKIDFLKWGHAMAAMTMGCSIPRSSVILVRMSPSATRLKGRCSALARRN